MKVSLNTIKQFIDFDLPPVSELVERINQQLGGVEEVIDLGVKYKDARIVRVVECDKHPDADRLSVCRVDVGEAELVQIVCGANNVHADMWAVWLPPESTVPSTYDDAEPFVLDARELRGVMSYGMLASARELGIGDDHDGIVDIQPGDVHQGSELQPGASFADMFGLNDTIIDIENKMFTHRPDLFGQLGVAREIAGIFGRKFTSPDWYMRPTETLSGEGLELTVFNDAGENVPRLMFVAMKDVTIKSSPLWLQCALVAMGSKPINNIVDATNYIMLLTAQPIHAYDYDTIRGRRIGARMARDGESVELLNGKKYQLTGDDIVIADGEGAIGLAGIMGGVDSEVTVTTQHVVLEVANFDMYAVRKSSMRHGLFTDALTRFNKGQSPLQNPAVLRQLVGMIERLAGGELASSVWDDGGELEVGHPVVMTTHFINDRLGLDLSQEEMTSLLENVEMRVADEDGSSHPNPGGKDYPVLLVFPPFWRTDIELPEDVVEEIGRLYGFDKLPRVLPRRSIKPVDTNLTRITKQQIRHNLSRAGANEVLTYSFVHENIIKNAEQDSSEAFQLSNALSPDLQYYRLTVLPSLLDKIRMNVKAGYGEFVLFEIGKGHNKKYHAADDNGLPSELSFVDMVYASKTAQEGAAFYRVRAYVEQLVNDFGRRIVCLPITENYQYPVSAPFDLSRSALVHDAETNEFIGLIGELKKSVRRSFKLPDYTAAATLDFAAFEKFTSEPKLNYQPISKYPSVSQDLSLELSSECHYVDIYDLATKTLSDELNDSYNWSLSPISIYQGDDKLNKVMSFRLRIGNYKSTLTDQQVQQFIAAIAQAASEVYGARQK